MSSEDRDEIVSDCESVTESEVSNSESESSQSEVEVPVVKAPPKKRVTKKDLGEIQRSDSPPPKARRKYAPRAPLSEEAKDKRRENLAKARAVRSAYAAERRRVKLEQELNNYQVQEESESSDEELVLTKKSKQKILPTKKEEKLQKEIAEAKEGKKILAKKKREPKEPKEKIVVDGPKTLEKKKIRKRQEERLRALEAITLDNAKKEKVDRSRQTIINIGGNEVSKEKISVQETKKMLLDLGL